MFNFDENRNEKPAHRTSQKQVHCKAIEGLHDAVCTYARTILSKSLGFLLHSAVWRKQQKTLELSIFFMEKFEISSRCVCWYSGHSVGILTMVMWYELNKKKWNNLLLFPILSHVNRKPTWRSPSVMTCKICLIWHHMKTLYCDKPFLPLGNYCQFSDNLISGKSNTCPCCQYKILQYH